MSEFLWWLLLYFLVSAIGSLIIGHVLWRLGCNDWGAWHNDNNGGERK